MKSIFFSVRVLFFLTIVSVWSHPGFTQLKPGLVQDTTYRYSIKTQSTDPHQLAQLGQWLSEKGYDVAGIISWKGEIEVISTEEGIKTLQDRGLKGTLKDLTEQELRPDAQYLNPNSVIQKIRALNENYPQLTRVEEIGRSIEGRPILALVVTSSPNPQDPANLTKPSLMVDALHHSREVMTAEVAMDVAETLIKGVVRGDPILSRWVGRWNIWVVPMVNVDGSNIVFSQNAMWRKNAYRELDKVYGVDINRNYSYNWAACNGSSPQKNSQTYRGSRGGSEPETRALMTLADRIRPTGSLSYHSYSELVLYPYGCNGALPGEKDFIIKTAREVAALLPKDSGGGTYTAGAPWELLYSVDGDSMSHIHAAYGSLALTFEINQDFQPPYSLKEPTLQKHRKAWMYFLNKMDTQLLTVQVVDGPSGNPVMAQIGISNIPQIHNELPLRTNQAGVFFKALDQGVYTISARLADGRQGSIEVQMQNQPKNIKIVVP